MKRIDETGNVYGRLTVESLCPYRRRGLAVWLCRCECGANVEVPGSYLRMGDNLSCGCLRRDRMSRVRRQTRTHGKSGTPEHDAWRGMLARCTNPRHRSYRDYGGRGITVCDRWRNSFENFLADMGNRPSSLHSLDRVNNDAGYEPSNCRWATKKQQGRNTRSNHRITFKGETLLVCEWAAKIGVSWRVISTRLSRGWSVERTLTTPVIRKARCKT